MAGSGPQRQLQQQQQYEDELDVPDVEEQEPQPQQAMEQQACTDQQPRQFHRAGVLGAGQEEDDLELESLVRVKCRLVRGEGRHEGAEGRQGGVHVEGGTAERESLVCVGCGLVREEWRHEGS